MRGVMCICACLCAFAQTCDSSLTTIIMCMFHVNIACRCHFLHFDIDMVIKYCTIQLISQSFTARLLMHANFGII